jgi:hypothetical protein
MAKNKQIELVDRQELEAFLDKVQGLEPYRDFIKTRWLKMVLWWDQRSREARKKYFLERGLGGRGQLRRDLA